MKPVFYQYMETPLGRLLAAGNEKELLLLSSSGKAEEDWKYKKTQILAMAEEQLSEYFSGKRKTFSVPLAPEGTDFQKRVWKELLHIPYGETRSYGQIAAAVGSPGGARAVGMANHNNPIMIMIPCHRVIGSNGKLTGYAGGLWMKELLLKLEKAGVSVSGNLEYGRGEGL